jgi:hypothetical protein
MLPNLVGIGAQRSGTTWIYQILKSHPDVFMSQEKELNFFDNLFDKGVDWYERFFRKSNQEKIIGEFSPTYLAHELVPQRMKEIVPEAKLIVSLRNPVDQIFSRYCYMVSRQLYDKPFDVALGEKKFLMEEAFYYNHITRFLEYFDRIQILILIYEDLTRDALSFLNQIYSFLEIDKTYIPPNVNERIHFTRMPRSQYIETSVVMIRKGLKKMRLFSLIEELKKTNIVNRMRDLNTTRVGAFGKMDPKTRSRLNNIFAEDKEMLSALLSRDLSFWN